MSTNYTNHTDALSPDRPRKRHTSFVWFVWFVDKYDSACGALGASHLAPHILNTPKRVSGIGALRDAEMDRPRTSRVWAGSMMPSSHRRAVAK